MLTPDEKESLQIQLLRLCNASSRFGLPESRLLQDCQRFGFDDLSKKEFDAEILHLEKAGLLATVGKVIRPDLRRWTTTAQGDYQLMEKGYI